jgi:hypothetical protein
MKTALKMVAAFWAVRGELDEPTGGGETTLRDTYISTYATLADFVPDDLAARVNPFYRFIRTGGARLKAGFSPASVVFGALKCVVFTARTSREIGAGLYTSGTPRPRPVGAPLRWAECFLHGPWRFSSATRSGELTTAGWIVIGC